MIASNITGDDRFANLSLPAFKLFVYLKDRECTHAREYGDTFYCTVEYLVEKTKLGKTSIIKAKKELAENGLIETWVTPRLHPISGEKTRVHISAYKMLA